MDQPGGGESRSCERDDVPRVHIVFISTRENDGWLVQETYEMRNREVSGMEISKYSQGIILAYIQQLYTFEGIE